MQRARPVRLAAAGVTAREAEVLAAVGRRLSNKEIADHLFISVRTVESHVSALLRKLGLSTRSDLVALALRLPGEEMLPEPTTSFIGRDAELADIARTLADNSLVCLVGPAGCGKTRLALEAARRWHADVRLVELSGAGANDVESLVGDVLSGGCEASDLVAAAVVALAGAQVLLVADGCEYVAEAAARVLALLIRSVPGLRVLATSQFALGIDGERVVPVGPLDGPAGSTPADVQACAAGRLFLDRALAASPSFRLDEDSAPHVAAICGHLDGLALAIELAAARIGSLDVGELAASLRHRPTVLEHPARADRHRSIVSAITWSWQLLDDEGRNMLRRLAVLPGEFPLALAQAITPISAVPDPRATLTRLVEQSLVSVRSLPGEPARYRLLKIIRAFAIEQPGPVVDDEVMQAHAWFVSQAANDAVSGPYRPRSTWVELDEANLLAALTWSASHDPAIADRLLTTASQLAETEPTRQLLEVIRDVALHCPHPLSSEALAWAGIAVQYLSLEDAGYLADASDRAASGERDEAFAHWIGGWTHARRADEDKAAGHLRAAIDYAGRAGEPWLEAAALQALGVARADLDEAFAAWEQSVIKYVVAGDLIHASNVRYMLASKALDAGIRLDDVPVWLTECESFASSHALRHELAHTRRARAQYLRIHGQTSLAGELLHQALPAFRQAGDFRCIARALSELAELSLPDEPRTAVNLLLDSLRAAAVADDSALQAVALGKLSRAAVADGDLVLAARCLGALSALAVDAGPGAESQPITQQPAYALYASEGRAGGVALITTLYPR